MQLPEKIQKRLGDRPGTVNNVGLSGSSVMMYDNCVLKIEDDSPNIRTSVQMIQWLEGKLPIPRILEHEFCGGKSYLLMEKAQGLMSCHARYLSDPNTLSAALAEALRTLWSVDPSGCPKTRSNKQYLLEARRRVEAKEIDYDQIEPETFGPNGFKDAEHLLCWLEDNCPEEDWALCHGDLSLPNVFLLDGHLSCFIDLGDTAMGDKWRDIAICHRSLDWNYKGLYGGKVYPNSDPNQLFEMLGIRPDWDRIRYHKLLDELF